MRLRSILFIAMLCVSTVPVIILAAWQQNDALEDEISSVKEKHLLVAGNLTAALDRYIKDAQAVFKTAANHLEHAGTDYDFSEMLLSLGFRHICRMDANGIILEAHCVMDCPAANQFPKDVFNALAKERAAAAINPGEVIMSNLLRNPSGAPSFYLVRANPDNSVVIGEMNTDYPRQIQKAVLFGRGGHAAIVDRLGQVIAHPLQQWVDEMKDISKLSVIQKMMNGESGVTQFFSPAAKEEMVAGFNVARLAGWGVMIPQPFLELVEKSNDLQHAVYGIAIFGIMIAMAISWWLSGVLARPLRKIADTATRVADGDMTLRASENDGFPLRETRELTQVFNHMLERTHSANEELKITSEHALAASRVKSEFLANMSHELRTPLNAIIGFSDMIRYQRLGAVGNPDYVEYAEDIQVSGRHLLDLINDILDISIVERGKLDLNKETLEIGEILRECIRFVEQSSHNKGLEFITEIADDLPELSVDRRAFRQVALNLLGNSAKFTPENGQITVSACTKNGQHIFTFGDNGPGIASDKIATITDPFVRSQSDPYKSQDGAGLGLAIVKSLVELHDGTLQVDSVFGGGTTVTVILPSSEEKSPGL